MKNLLSLALLLGASYSSSLKNEKTYDFNPSLPLLDEDVQVFCPEPDYIEYLRGWHFAIHNFFFCGARARHGDKYYTSDDLGVNGLEMVACHKLAWEN